MKDNFSQVKKFDKWMLKIKNIHYANIVAMSNAYQKIKPLTADRAIIDFKIERSRFRLSKLV